MIGEELLQAFEEIKDDLQLAADDKLYFQPENGEVASPPGDINLADVLGNEPTHNPATTGDIMLGDPFADVFTSGTTSLPLGTAVSEDSSNIP